MNRPIAINAMPVNFCKTIWAEKLSLNTSGIFLANIKLSVNKNAYCTPWSEFTRAGFAMETENVKSSSETPAASCPVAKSRDVFEPNMVFQYGFWALEVSGFFGKSTFLVLGISKSARPTGISMGLE